MSVICYVITIVKLLMTTIPLQDRWKIYDLEDRSYI